MNFEKLKLKALLLFVVGITGLQAQVSVLTTAGNALGSSGSVSYSVGQVFYTTNNGTNGSVAQGVQQPFEITTVTGIEEAKGISLFGSVYPNPTIDVIQLKIETSKSLSSQSLRYELFDIQGKLLDSKELDAEVTNIVMGKLCAASYFLKVIQLNTEIKTFKIIKK